MSIAGHSSSMITGRNFIPDNSHKMCRKSTSSVRKCQGRNLKSRTIITSLQGREALFETSLSLRSCVSSVLAALVGAGGCRNSSRYLDLLDNAVQSPWQMTASR